MVDLLAPLRPRRPTWPTLLVLAASLVVGGSRSLSSVAIVRLLVPTVTALAGGTACVLGVSAGISAYVERETYADPDCYR